MIISATNQPNQPGTWYNGLEYAPEIVMKIAVGSDERTNLTDAVVDALRLHGHEIELVGPLAGDALLWPDVGCEVAEQVATGRADQGVLFCWTGTGVSIAANKVPGIRAALCADAETARGARRWNDANILVMGLRLTSEAVALEMLDAWFSAESGDETDRACVARVQEIERGSGLATIR
jgi:ribose 5-phosphate isomerase B